jgi:hypothetical protein
MTPPPQATVLAARRALLRECIAQQRKGLGDDARQLQAALSPAALAARGWARARRHPSWLLAGAAALLVLRRFGTRRWLGHALTAWQLWQTIRGQTGRGHRP